MLNKLFAAAALSLPLLASAQLVNGSFETPSLSPAAQVTEGNGSTAITGWTVINEVHWINNYLGLAGSQGNQWVDLTGNKLDAYGNGLSQTFAGTAGETYTLSLDVGSLLSSQDASVAVSVNGSPATVFTNTAPGTGLIMNWATFSLNFTGAASNTVTFLSSAPGSTTVVGLDNVSVTAVPEPQTIAMFLAGLAAVGSLARRRGMGK